MRGKARTPKSNVSDLATIFFRIRTTRDAPTMRSWQRRARLALAQRIDLTPAQRHEIMCVWRRSDCHLIDSPAMRALLRADGSAASEWETAPARQHMRASFDAAGERVARAKKPGHARLDFGVPANDSVFSSGQLFLFSNHA